MNNLRITSTPKQQEIANNLYADIARRVAAAPQITCPVDLASAFVKLCHVQSCGKCVPCRVGLGSLAAAMDKIISGRGTEKDLVDIRRMAQTIYDSADCAIGSEAARVVLDSFEAFYDDYEAHINHGTCTANFADIPCNHGCPAHVDIPGYIALTKAGRYDDAIRVIRKDNPFPSVCALVCEHPCEHHCRHKLIDSDAVNIRGIKRFAVENSGDVPAPEKATASGKTVAVIGGGPAGLTAAYYLSLMGHKVTVYEMNKRLGGMLRYGIPTYRLPDSYLDRDINTILSLGVEVVYKTIGKDISFEQVRSQYDSTYIAIGAHAGKSLGVKGDDKIGVMSAVELLRAVGDNETVDIKGKRVLVVGGGNVAMDACRTAIRLGAASVKCVYRRRQIDMTAMPEEVEGAIAEGVDIMQLYAPVEVLFDENDKVTALAVKPQMVGDMSWGRPAPKNSSKPVENIEADIIISAIGQAIDSAHFGEAGIPINREALVANPYGGISNMDGVFAGGDAVSRPATVIRAIEAGKVAASNIDKFLGYSHEIVVDIDIPRASAFNSSKAGRVNLLETPADIRRDNFDLAELSMSKEEAMQECSRCLRCDQFGIGAMRTERSRQW